MPANNETGQLLSRAAAMRAYDKLPKTLRAEIANADRNWSPQWFVEQYKWGVGCYALVEIIRQDQALQRAKYYRYHDLYTDPDKWVKRHR
jgi:hypothetical protein